MPDSPTDRCRCSHPRLAHTGAYGHAEACTASCGCSFFEPAALHAEPPPEEPPDAETVTAWPVPGPYFYGGFPG